MVEEDREKKGAGRGWKGKRVGARRAFRMATLYAARREDLQGSTHTPALGRALPGQQDDRDLYESDAWIKDWTGQGNRVTTLCLAVVLPPLVCTC